MKKILSLVLVLVLALSCSAMLFACTQDPADNNGDNNNGENNAPAAKEYTLAIAVDDGFKTVNNKGKVTNIALALVIDADGKIAAARFESVEASLAVTDGEITTVNRLTTKVEKGDEYTGMTAGSWEAQSKAFANFLVGKTAADVAALDTSAESVKGETPLVAGCTMTSSTPVFQALVAKAFAYERKVTFETAEAITVGFAVDAKLSGTVDAGAKVAADYAAVVVAGGKVVASMLDSAEGSYTFAYNTEEEKYDITATYNGTKNEQGDAYDSFSPMAAGRWYAQAQAYANTAVGKTVEELANLSTDPITGCTIYTGGYKAVIVRAAGYAN